MSQTAPGDQGARAGRKRFERFLEGAVVLAALATVPLVVLQEWGFSDPALAVADWAVWGIFLAEYVLMVIPSPDRWASARRHWFSAAITVLSFPLMPALLELVRLGRLASLLRLLRLAGVTTRGVGALRIVLGRPGVVYLGTLVGILMLAAAGALDLLEPETVKGDFWNGLWWAIVTTTTVGYGDIAPVTVGGRIVGVVLMFLGIGMVATLAASIAAYFVEQDTQRREASDVQRLEERLSRIEKMLHQIEDTPPEQGTPR